MAQIGGIVEYSKREPDRIIAHSWKLSVEEVNYAVVQHMKSLGADAAILDNIDRFFLHYVGCEASPGEEPYYVVSGETYEDKP